jgi:hypothetical protein
MNGSLAENSKEGSVIRKHNVFNTSASYYSLAATKDYIHTGDGKMPMHFVFSTNNLSTGTYSIANGKLNHVNIIKFGGTKAHWIAPFDNDGSIFIVNVTKVTNGFADGNFSGNFSSQRIGGSAIQITEGEFKNVKILE